MKLINIKERDFNFDLGEIFIRHPKAGDPKFVPMLEEDLELVKSFPESLHNEYFFRHATGYGGVKVGKQFGKDYLYKCWPRACRALGITGVDLYGGTKHSTVTALRKHYSPEQIKKATMHQTNKPFERYFQVQLDDVREIHRTGRTEKELRKKKGGSDKAKVINIAGQK